MMIEHVALYTLDLERLRAFYENILTAQPVSRTTTRNRPATYFISFAGGARLELMTRPELEAGERRSRLGRLDASGFKAGTRENVDALTERIRADGYEVVSGPRITGDGYYESCVLDPDGNTVEIVA